MSQQGLARRSASHGALNSSYAAQGHASSDSGHQMPSFRPLRSIREHTHAYLDPAASVDGMLRKTTETGNIGIFSINNNNNNRLHYQLYPKPNNLRARASLNDLRPPPRPFSRSSDRPRGQDDRRHLPSYRDSTSEIISMYGSENHSSKSLSSSLTTPCDDLGQRSYSMTTCGSRGYFMSRSNGGQQSDEYQGRGQRPRSPYPYPTRLPRPGIRPSSPALTENGDIDYRKMVAINRVSHRTTHHPYKTLFPYKTTRNPLPLSLRQDANEATRSFSEDRVAHRLYPSRPQFRPPLPSHLHEWDGRPGQRLESGSSVQSLRTMSLTSLSGGHGYASPRTPRLPPAPKQPIFYDYSEDFEDVTETPPVCTIAPIPQRVSNPYRPMDISKNCDMNAESMDEARHEFVAYLQENTVNELPDGNVRHGSEQEGSPSELCGRNDPVQNTTHNPVMEYNPESGSSASEAVHAVDFGALAPRLSGKQEADGEGNPDVLDPTKKAVITELASDSSTLDDPPEPKTPALTTNMPARDLVRCREDLAISMDLREDQLADRDVDSAGEFPEEQLRSVVASAPSGDPKPRQIDGTASSPHMSSDRCHDSRFYSLGSGLSDLASFVHQVDRHFQTTGPNSHDRLSAEVVKEGEARDDSTIAPLEFSAGQRETDEHHLDRDATGITHPPRLSSLRQHRRHHAELRVNTEVDDNQQYQVVSTRSGPTLVPQPISPAKLLRVKNSIPQLMKALPPLPDFDPSPNSPFGPTVVPMEFEKFELSGLTDARSTLSDAGMSKSRGEEVPKSYDSFVFDQKARKPKLRLRHAASFAHEQPRDLRRGYLNHGHGSRHDTSDRRPATATEYSTAPIKRKLPIKVSRPTLTSLVSENSETVKRRPGFQQSSTVSELASSQPIDLFSSSTGLRVFPTHTESPSSRQISPETPEQASAPVIKVTHVARIQKVPVDDADARGSSLDSYLDTLRLPNANNEAAADGEMQSFFSDNSLARPPRGLKERISDLKSRLAESRHHHRSPLRNMLRDDNNDGTGTLLAAESQSTNTFKTLLSSLSQAKPRPHVASNRKVRNKLEKFVKGAKHRLRNWGKAKHRIN